MMLNGRRKAPQGQLKRASVSESCPWVPSALGDQKADTCLPSPVRRVLCLVWLGGGPALRTTPRLQVCPSKLLLLLLLHRPAGGATLVSTPASMLMPLSRHLQ